MIPESINQDKAELTPASLELCQRAPDFITPTSASSSLPQNQNRGSLFLMDALADKRIPRVLHSGILGVRDSRGSFLEVNAQQSQSKQSSDFRR